MSGKIEYLRSKSLSARVIGADGRRRRATGKNIAELQAEIERLQTLTTRDAWAVYVSTLQGRWKRIVEAFGETHVAPLLGLRPERVTPQKMAQWWTALRQQKKLSSKTSHNVYQSFAAACRMAGWEPLPWGRWRPPPHVPQETREAAVTIDELQEIVRAARRYDERPHSSGDMTARLGIAALCGLRQGEMCGLAWDDWDEHSQTLHVRRALKDKGDGRRPETPPKGNRQRLQTLHPNAVALLQEQRENLKKRGHFDPRGPVFPTRGGAWRRTPVCIAPIELRKIIKDAGLPNVGAWVTHSLRHTFSTLETTGAFLSTGDVKAAMARTGHRRAETLVGYLHRGKRGLPPSFVPAFDLPPVAPPTVRVDALTPNALTLNERTDNTNAVSPSEDEENLK